MGIVPVLWLVRMQMWILNGTSLTFDVQLGVRLLLVNCADYLNWRRQFCCSSFQGCATMKYILRKSISLCYSSCPKCCPIYTLWLGYISTTVLYWLISALTLRFCCALLNVCLVQLVMFTGWQPVLKIVDSPKLCGLQSFWMTVWRRRKYFPADAYSSELPTSRKPPLLVIVYRPLENPPIIGHSR